jgi:hypothetical protein
MVHQKTTASALQGSQAARAAEALASKLDGLGNERRVPEKGELERLDAEVALRAADMSSKSLSLTFWAYARLRRGPANTAQAQVDAAVDDRLGEFSAKDLALSLWAYATMGQPPAAALQARIDEHVARTLGAWPTRYGHTRRWAGRRPLPCRLASMSWWRAHSKFNAQGLANSLWAYAKMGRPPPAALQARIDEHVAGTLGEFKVVTRRRAALTRRGNSTVGATIVFMKVRCSQSFLATRWATVGCAAARGRTRS